MPTLEDSLDSDGIIAECSYRSTHQRVQIVRRGFGQAMLGISPKPPLQDIGAYFNSWDFPTVQAALDTLVSWNPDESPEPDDRWHRHPATGRFRIRGDKRLEYVRDAVGESIEKQIAYAIHVTRGLDYTVECIEENTGAAPEGHCHFSVWTECREQQRYFSVFYYCGRYVVISAYDSWVTVDNVKQRLTDPWPNP